MALTDAVFWVFMGKLQLWYHSGDYDMVLYTIVSLFSTMLMVMMKCVDDRIINTVCQARESILVSRR